MEYNSRQYGKDHNKFCFGNFGPQAKNSATARRDQTIAQGQAVGLLPKAYRIFEKAR
jgi:hypothetical protein